MQGFQRTANTDRLMFYMVERDGVNGHKLTEAFCTSFLHKAKAVGSGAKPPKVPKKLLKVAERWREEWNRGVQMPLQDVKRLTCDFEAGSNSLVGFHAKENFELPVKHLARDRKRKYASTSSASSSRFEIRPTKDLYHYQIDVVDEQWLADVGGRRPTSKKSPKQVPAGVTRKDFLECMNSLEVDCYKKIHQKLLAPLNDQRHDERNDDDADCEVCRMPEWELGDEIVFCDGCNVSVHQSCYGLTSLPTNEWLCNTCAADVSSPSCVFCPLLGGAMKYAKEVDAWAHVACALWIPEVRFGDVDKREPILNVSHIPAERWSESCSVCDTRNGVCIGCSEEGCFACFHISCALRAGLVLRIESDQSQVGGYRMVSLCYDHSAHGSALQTLSPRAQKSPIKKRIDNTHALESMMGRFWAHVSCEAIAAKHGISPPVAAAIFKYWKWKRAHMNFRPLIRQPIDIRVEPPSLTLDAGRRSRPVQAHKAKSITPHAGPRRAFSPLSAKQMHEYEKLRDLRQNLEKARNLCYLLVKREREKKKGTGLLEEASAVFDKVNMLHTGSGSGGGNRRKTIDASMQFWMDELIGLAAAADYEDESEETENVAEKFKFTPPTPPSKHASAATKRKNGVATGRRAKLEEMHDGEAPPAPAIVHGRTASQLLHLSAPEKIRRVVNNTFDFGGKYRKRRGGSSASSSTLTSSSSSSPPQSESLYSLAESSTLYKFEQDSLSDDERPVYLKPMGRASLPSLAMRKPKLNGLIKPKVVKIAKNGDGVRQRWGLATSTGGTLPPGFHRTRLSAGAPDGLRYNNGANHWATKRFR